ncbi:heparin lyase I family protein [Mycolicibacterium hippocampi]|uniref:Polysaccharide lyase-like protein n=1 Tax=Mycolicibacterium hippocampi TaxID=659824 RepID=A0A850PQ57_9MYCO|nr:heparin lyase I family protein [Mycolicibacterium hippocampi]NVN52768.1 hypothetical protein [Mycolicibacterium hippocampi]
MDRRTVLLLGGIGVLSLGTPTPASRAEAPGSSSTLFNGDFETGDTSQYAKTELAGGSNAPRIVTAPTRSRSSQYACAYKLSESQYRCESVPGYGYAPFVGTEGSDLYYRWSVYFPDEFPEAPWQVCGQWHQTYMGGTGRYDKVPPPMAFYAASSADRAARWSLSNNGNNPWQKGWSLDLGLMPRGEWTDVVVHVKFSVVARDCLVEVWINGVESGSIVPPVPTLYPTEVVSDRVSYFKVGYYRDPKATLPGAVFFDDVKIGTTLGSVAPSS